jgi:hypothetical protein
VSQRAYEISLALHAIDKRQLLEVNLSGLGDSKPQLADHPVASNVSQRANESSSAIHLANHPVASNVSLGANESSSATHASEAPQLPLAQLSASDNSSRSAQKEEAKPPSTQADAGSSVADGRSIVQRLRTMSVIDMLSMAGAGVVMFLFLVLADII